MFFLKNLSLEQEKPLKAKLKEKYLNKYLKLQCHFFSIKFKGIKTNYWFVLVGKFYGSFSNVYKYKIYIYIYIVALFKFSSTH